MASRKGAEALNSHTQIGRAVRISDEKSVNGKSAVLSFGETTVGNSACVYFSGMFRKDEDLTPSQRYLAVRWVCFTVSRRARAASARALSAHGAEADRHSGRTSFVKPDLLPLHTPRRQGSLAQATH